MAVTIDYRYPGYIHPLHAVFLAGTIPLFLGAALSDAAYASTYEIQWSNFAAWLIAGGLVFGTVALLCALIGLARPTRRHRGGAAYFLVLLITWVLGIVNALVHARDAWAIMPTGLVLSVIVTVLACIAAWLGLRTPRMREST
ncbi:hypothetical protein FOZ76_24465 [Verticiella sediminum]|uniref:DUF2231 domain-containing protein n=1 Tax=Verticiella sediminum TaxID=1247510 RepID=A0A556A7F1_9BURK|nr:DUF2231 domain-containing protein [Verticiella sediminum]TSH88802.1 hypothetical protein FOZ76_24465 [Verticiella sediminum]